jgi:hypothetical protein
VVAGGGGGERSQEAHAVLGREVGGSLHRQQGGAVGRRPTQLALALARHHQQRFRAAHHHPRFQTCNTNHTRHTQPAATMTMSNGLGDP